MIINEPKLGVIINYLFDCVNFLINYMKLDSG